MKKIIDIWNRSIDQLNQDLSLLKREQFNLRFRKSTGQLEKTSNIKNVRKNIARIKTVLHKKIQNK